MKSNRKKKGSRNATSLTVKKLPTISMKVGSVLSSLTISIVSVGWKIGKLMVYVARLPKQLPTIP